MMAMLASLISNYLVLCVIIPQLKIDKFVQKLWAYHLELASKDMAYIYVAEADIKPQQQIEE
jgi:hypothetical protein